jgi:hypothetical protein
VRLLRIQNPHGKGEWKGEWSDRSDIWEKLLEHDHSGISGLQRSMRNDGTFWIDYDSFLMEFCNVDAVLAFKGNHAKSFPSNFPPKWTAWEIVVVLCFFTCMAMTKSYKKGNHNLMVSHFL